MYEVSMEKVNYCRKAMDYLEKNVINDPNMLFYSWKVTDKHNLIYYQAPVVDGVVGSKIRCMVNLDKVM